MLIKELWLDARELAQEAYGSSGPKHMLRALLTQDSYTITSLHRLRLQARRYHIPFVAHAMRLVQTVIHGIEVGKDVSLGHGVYFVHPLGTVVGGNAKIGDRVRFFGNNTVGTAKENGYPTIEADVWVGAGARILGPICIGRGARIGANAVVVCDIPAGAIAVGVPAKFKAQTQTSDQDPAQQAVQKQPAQKKNARKAATKPTGSTPRRSAPRKSER